MAVQMNMNVALRTLQEKADELASIQNFNKVDSNTQFGYIAPVLQWYKFIVDNTTDSNVKQAADSILWNIATINSSTAKVVKSIYDGQNGIQTKTQSVAGVDPNKISRTIDSLVAEVSAMGRRGIDPDRLGEIEWNLKKMRSILSESRSSFYPQEFQRLLEQSNAALNQINSYTSVMESADRKFDF